MGYNQRNDEIRNNVERMRRAREAYADAFGDCGAIHATFGQAVSVVLADHFRRAWVECRGARGSRIIARHGDINVVREIAFDGRCACAAFVAAPAIAPN